MVVCIRVRRSDEAETATVETKDLLDSVIEKGKGMKVVVTNPTPAAPAVFG